MKWFVYIFSLYLLILSGFTCSAADDCCKDEVKTEESAGRQDDDDHKPVSPCVPFLACGACHSVLTPQINIELPESFSLKEKILFFYSEASLVSLAFSFWQPPQIS